MKQRLGSSYCAKNRNRQERTKVGAKDSLTEELTRMTCTGEKKKKKINTLFKEAIHERE